MTEKVITFKKHKVKYDADAIGSWRVQRLMAAGGSSAFEAVDIILLGRSDEVADLVGGGMDDMAELITAIVALEGGAAKN